MGAHTQKETDRQTETEKYRKTSQAYRQTLRKTHTHTNRERENGYTRTETDGQTETEGRRDKTDRHTRTNTHIHTLMAYWLNTKNRRFCLIYSGGNKHSIKMCRQQFIPNYQQMKECTTTDVCLTLFCLKKIVGTHMCGVVTLHYLITDAREN